MFHFKGYAYWFIAPALAVIAVFAVYPLFHTLALSMLSFDLHRGTSSFAGLGNYAALLSDPRTGGAFLNTFIFAAASVFFELVFGLLLALLLDEQFRGRGVARAASLAPWAIPMVVAALLWRWIFNDRFGIINQLIVLVGGTPEVFLASPGWSRFAVIVVEVWKTTPFVALLLLAGLQLIPIELYESSTVDGAGPWQRFRYVTLPLVMPVMLIALLFRTMDALRIFDTVYVLTGGGPGNATETLSLFTYKEMFAYLDFGAGAALAVLTFAVVALVSLVYGWQFRRANRAKE